MASRPKSQQILNEAVALRAEAYRRWRRAAEAEPLEPLKRLYLALAHLECDRYDELVGRFLEAARRPASVADLEPGGGAPRFAVPAGTASGAALRAAAHAAEQERRSWSARLRQTNARDPERVLLSALVEDARRVRDLVGPREAGAQPSR